MIFQDSDVSEKEVCVFILCTLNVTPLLEFESGLLECV